MLTKSDLQQIGNVIDSKLTPIETDIKVIHKDVKYLKKKVNKMNKTLDIVAKNYDEGDVKLEKRLSKVEQHLDL